MNLIKFTGIFLLFFFPLFQLTSVAENNKTGKNLDLDIVFIGNSITYGANLVNPKQDAPTSYCF